MSEEINKKEENKQWNILYEYVKKEILEYTDDMQLPRFMILRLRGLRNGKFMANKNSKSMASYDYNTILLTFKACRHDILRYTKQNNFKDEQHRFNYVMVIIENNINDIVMRLKNVKKQEKKIDTIDIETIKRDESAEYTKKSKETTDKRLDDLW